MLTAFCFLFIRENNLRSRLSPLAIWEKVNISREQRHSLNISNKGKLTSLPGLCLSLSPHPFSVAYPITLSASYGERKGKQSIQTEQTLSVQEKIYPVFRRHISHRTTLVFFSLHIFHPLSADLVETSG